MQTYLHVAGSTQNSCGSTVFGVTGDHVSHGLQLPLSPPFFNGCDLLTPDASATTVFTGAGGQPAAVRTSDGVYPMTTFLAFPFEGVSDTDPDPNNEAMLVRRIIEWLELDPRIFSDQFEGGSIDRWSSIRTAD